MKATLKFTLPEENADHKVYTSAPNLLWALQEYSNYIRHQEKYAETPDTTEIMRKRFYEILEDNEVHLDELV